MAKSRKPKLIECDGQAHLKLDGLEAMAWIPRCEKTGANIDLHLVAYKDPDSGESTAGILGSDFRHLVRKSTSLSIPIFALNAGTIRMLERRGKIPAGTKGAEELKAWLQQGVDLGWKGVAEARSAHQTSFDLDEAGALSL